MAFTKVYLVDTHKKSYLDHTIFVLLLGDLSEHSRNFVNAKQEILICFQ